MFSRPMQLAEYFCAGFIDDSDEYHHYALNVPLYTHFTSPIRRLAQFSPVTLFSIVTTKFQIPFDFTVG